MSIALSSPLASTSALIRLHSALEAAGTKRTGPRRFRLGPRLTIHMDTISSKWVQLVTSSIHLRRPAGSILEERRAPAGPFKLIPGSGRSSVALRADFPLFLDSLSGLQPADLSSTDMEEDMGEYFDPCAPWAVDLVRAVRRLAGIDSRQKSTRRAKKGNPLPSSVCTSLEVLQDWLQRAGWKVTASPEALRVSIQGKRFFNEVLLRLNEPTGGAGETGASLEMELARTRGWPEKSLLALEATAREANNRLNLVRLILRDQGGHGQLIAQVVLTGRLIGTPWTLIALDALRGAAELLSREVPALVDPVLAELVLKCSPKSPAS